MKTPPIEIVIADPAWKKLGKPFIARIREVSALALKQTKLSSSSRAKVAQAPGMTILFAGDEKVRDLNVTFRGQDKPTNVLAFPAGAPDYLGDIAIAHGVTAAEAKAGKKPLSDHAAHLALHGALHLLGYDHGTAREAKVMESLETKLLAELGIADPYARDRKAAKR
jgi:probable rRNA maturation factor